MGEYNLSLSSFFLAENKLVKSSSYISSATQSLKVPSKVKILFHGYIKETKVKEKKRKTIFPWFWCSEFYIRFL